jgi:hypothetical protein
MHFLVSVLANVSSKDPANGRPIILLGDFRRSDMQDGGISRLLSHYRVIGLDSGMGVDVSAMEVPGGWTATARTPM